MVKLKLIKIDPNNPKTWKFEELPKGSKEGAFYMDGKLFNNLSNVKKLIRDDWDYVYVIDGEVGSGKSVFVQQLNYFCSDGDFNVEEITFKPKEFKEQILKSDKYNGVTFDEAFRGMSARGSLGQTNKMLMSLMNEIRQRNLFVFIVIPSVWDLDKHISLFRCKGLFHIFTGEGKQRGFWKFYANKEVNGKNRFKKYFSDSKNRYEYPFWYDLQGKFTKFRAIDKDIYEKKKSKSLGDYDENEGLRTHRTEKDKDMIIRSLIYFKDVLGFTHKKIGEIYNLSEKATEYRYRKAKALEKTNFDEQTGALEGINLKKEVEINNIIE